MRRIHNVQLLFKLNHYCRILYHPFSRFQVRISLSFENSNLSPYSECPFLQGRSFVFASQYTRLLPSGFADQYLKAAVEVLEAPEATVPIKVSAVKAIQKYVVSL